MTTKISKPPTTEGHLKPAAAWRVEQVAEGYGEDAPRVEIFVSYGNGWGGRMSMTLTPEQYLKHAGQERALFSQTFGIPWVKIAEWSANRGRIRCIAKTKKGLQCKSYISATEHKDPLVWAKADAAGGYCVLHGAE